MLDLTRRFAAALMEYAEENGLRLIYQQALACFSEVDAVPPEPLGAFMKNVPSEIALDVLGRFLDLAHGVLDILDARIISAVPLTPEQLEGLTQKLNSRFHKHLNITTTVDPSILGGVRVIVGNMVIDDSIKRKLQEMKKSVYKGVYLKT